MILMLVDAHGGEVRTAQVVVRRSFPAALRRRTSTIKGLTTRYQDRRCRDAVILMRLPGVSVVHLPGDSLRGADGGADVAAERSPDSAVARAAPPSRSAAPTPRRRPGRRRRRRRRCLCPIHFSPRHVLRPPVPPGAYVMPPPPMFYVPPLPVPPPPAPLLTRSSSSRPPNPPGPSQDGGAAGAMGTKKGRRGSDGFYSFSPSVFGNFRVYYGWRPLRRLTHEA